MKIFRVTFYPEKYIKGTTHKITDVTPILNKVKYFEGSVEYFYGESPIRNPEWYSVQVKADNPEKAKEKGMKHIEKFKKEKQK